MLRENEIIPNSFIGFITLGLLLLTLLSFSFGYYAGAVESSRIVHREISK
jgi:hypothetical protein